jgi:hypothetical protein
MRRKWNARFQVKGVYRLHIPFLNQGKNQYFEIRDCELLVQEVSECELVTRGAWAGT